MGTHDREFPAADFAFLAAGRGVVSVQNRGVQHEYSTIKGVVEDVTDIILNIKQLRLKLLSDEDAMLRLDVSGEGEVKASDIEKNPDVEILNPDLHIATINRDAKLKIEMHVSDGRGYVSAEQNKREDDPVGTIPIDALFSPIIKVNYVGRKHARRPAHRPRQDHHGRVDRRQHFRGRRARLRGQSCCRTILTVFINFEGELEPVEENIKDEKIEKLRQLLKMRVDELELSVRSANCLRAAQYPYACRPGQEPGGGHAQVQEFRQKVPHRTQPDP